MLVLEAVVCVWGAFHMLVASRHVNHTSNALNCSTTSCRDSGATEMDLDILLRQELQ